MSVVKPVILLLQRYKLAAFIVTIHLMMKFLLSTFFRWAWTRFGGGGKRPVLLWGTYLRKIYFVGLFAVLDIWLSQWGLELISITLYTMTKTTTVIWMLFFGILFGVERLSCRAVTIVAMISGGLFLFVHKSTSFDMWGFTVVFSASVTSGIRWILCQRVMQRDHLGLGHPLDLIYHVQPMMLMSLVPLVGIFDGESCNLLLALFRSISRLSIISEEPYCHGGRLPV